MSLYNIPVFCPEDSESNDIKPMAMSRFASYSFIVKYSSLWLSVVIQSIRYPSVTEQNTTHANPEVVQVRHAIFPCFTKLY